jgi:hypothetical protein
MPITKIGYGISELIDPDAIINNETLYQRPTLGKSKPHSKDPGRKRKKLLAFLLVLFIRVRGIEILRTSP